MSGKKKERWQPIEEKKQSVVHKVRWTNETLSVIAKWYSGDTTNWRPLADANPNINPNCLTVDNVVFIPSNLIKNTKPMPKTFLEKYLQNLKKPKNISQNTGHSPLGETDDEDEFEVFGPK